MKTLKIIGLVLLSIFIFVAGLNLLFQIIGLLVVDLNGSSEAYKVGYFLGQLSLNLAILGLSVWGVFKITKSMKKKIKSASIALGNET